MSNKVFTLAIGIPAYNEEANIARLIRSLLDQRTANFELKEIIIVSDASTDHTVKRIREVEDPRISLIENSKRIGTALSQNKIVEQFDADLLFLINADSLPSNNQLLERIVAPFYAQEHIGIVCPQILPIEGRGIFESVINYSVAFKKEMYQEWKGGENLYLCVGVARLFPRQFIKQAKWVPAAAEDAYSYFACIANGYKFFYEPSGTVYYRSPTTFIDHFRQSKRFFAGSKTLDEYFPRNIVRDQYAIPHNIKVRKAIKYLVKNPMYFLLYCGVLLLVRLSPRKKAYLNPAWITASSSKKVEI